MGRFYNDSIAVEYRALYDNAMQMNIERGTCEFRHDEANVFSVEELVGMQLAHAKDQAKKYFNESISDAFITVCFVFFGTNVTAQVPPFWTHHERRALLDAAEIAGLRVISLINDETAGNLKLFQFFML